MKNQSTTSPSLTKPTLTETTGSTVLNTIKPPTYVLDAQSLVEWLMKSETRLCGVALPEGMTQDLAALEILISSFGASSSSLSSTQTQIQCDSNSLMNNDDMVDHMIEEDDRYQNENQNQNSAASSNIKGMLAVTSSAQKILRIGASLGGDIFLYVLSKLFRAAVVSTYLIVLYCIVLYCIVLYCIALCCIVLHRIVLCRILFYFILYYIILYYIVLYCIVLYCIVLYCIVLYCIVLYCIVLYCIVLY